MALNFNRKLIPTKVVTLSAAQIAALYTTPVVIVPDTDLPDLEFYQFMCCMLVYEPGSTPFTIGSASNFSIGYTGGAAASGVVAAAGLIDQSESVGALLQPVSGMILPQAGLELRLAGGNPSAGDGTLGVKVLYRDPAMRVLEDEF